MILKYPDPECFSELFLMILHVPIGRGFLLEMTRDVDFYVRYIGRVHIIYVKHIFYRIILDIFKKKLYVCQINIHEIIFFIFCVDFQ